MKQMVHPPASDVCCRANCTLPQRRPGSKRQIGAVAVIFAGSLMMIIGFFGLALDLSRVYNRKIEMQGVADTIAVAAAQKLNGKSSGITAALAAAQDIMQTGNYRPKYNYTHTMNWSDAAIKFGRLVNGNVVWLDATEAPASADELMYVKVDTTALDSPYGKVDMLFMPIMASTLTSISVGHTAVAGRSRLSVTPLGICAMSDTRIAQRPNTSGNVELVEYGFRRGVSYNLMNLNPKGAAKANFLVDPLAAPGSGSSSTLDEATVGRYICTGTVALSKVSGATVYVQSGFPLNLFFDHLNSRFDKSQGKCDPYAAPPDSNVKQYTFGTTNWMNPKATMQTAKTNTTATPARLQTIADLVPNHQTAGDYGPLWAYARPVLWSSVEPPAGYTPFAATTPIWGSLYANGSALTTSVPNLYPAGATATPYFTSGTSLAPTVHFPGIPNRRVLNIPLLACPVTGSVATVNAIGRFFMTVQADANIISAEFAGLASDHQLDGPVELSQ
jgi:hypothetical protein